MDLLDPGKTVFETVQDAIPMENIGVVRNLCAAFLFQGDAVEKKVIASPAERRAGCCWQRFLPGPLTS